jgi:hypothetical protein
MRNMEQLEIRTAISPRNFFHSQETIRKRRHGHPPNNSQPIMKKNKIDVNTETARFFQKGANKRKGKGVDTN